MRVAELAQLTAFETLVQELNFRRAARRLNTSASALSRTIKALEQRVGTPLFNRTTRSVSLTAHGRTLAEQALPALSTLQRALADLGSTAGDPAGEIRVNLTQLAAQLVFAPRLGDFGEAHPRIRLHLVVNDALDDVIAQGCDAGVRLSTTVPQDMVAVPVTRPLRVAIVGAPRYFERHPVPRVPADLADHRCIAYCWGADRVQYRWRLIDRTGPIDATPDAYFVVSDAEVMLHMAVSGAGLAYTLADRVEQELAAGTLVQVLADYCPELPAFCLYYPAGRQPPPALRAVASFFRQRLEI